MTHGSDRILWALRKPALTQEQFDIAKGWLAKIDQEVAAAEAGTGRDPAEVLTLREDKKFEWENDWRWERAMGILGALEAKVPYRL